MRYWAEHMILHLSLQKSCQLQWGASLRKQAGELSLQMREHPSTLISILLEPCQCCSLFSLPWGFQGTLFSFILLSDTQIVSTFQVTFWHHPLLCTCGWWRCRPASQQMHRLPHFSLGQRREAAWRSVESWWPTTSHEPGFAPAAPVIHCFGTCSVSHLCLKSQCCPSLASSELNMGSTGMNTVCNQWGTKGKITFSWFKFQTRHGVSFLVLSAVGFACFKLFLEHSIF